MLMTTELLIDGMTCGNCARHVTEAIQSVPEVRSASVSLEGRYALVQWKSSENIPGVLEAVRRAGYDAKKAEADNHAPRRKDWQPGLWLGIAVTAALMSGEWVFQLSPDRWFQWSSFALAGVVQIFAGAQFYRGAWRQLKNGSSNMDTLVALGSTTAFGYSAWALLSGAGGQLYFMEAAAIIALISLGHWIEARVSEKASGALKLLLNLAPQTALKISRDCSAGERAPAAVAAESPQGTADAHCEMGEDGDDCCGAKEGMMESHGCDGHRKSGEPEEVAVATLKMGDEILLRPGDHVPVDGIIEEGESAVDESSLTGESAPVEKKSGGELFAGTVNLNGRLIMRVTATGDETALARVIAAVRHAQTSRAEIQRLGDRVSSVFVPAVVIVAIAAGFWWGLAPASAHSVHAALAHFLWAGRVPVGAGAGFITAAAILIIACPCAMGLATPAAIMAGANSAARRGILIRDGVALEKAGNISALIFDKTGTLTAGKPEVAEMMEIRTSKFEARSLAASLAGNSAHPISRAIAKISAERVQIANWREIRGAGIEAETATEKMRLGSIRWLGENGVDHSRGEKFISEWSDKGASIIGLAAGGNLLALFALHDSVKPGAADVVAQLRRSGLKVCLLTGDNFRTATAVARQTGIAAELVFAEVRPEQKAEFVKKLQASGERVAFVGDGINDAPAISQANLGIAVSRASDIAREAADIILLKSEIAGVPEALGLARSTLRTIKQNLFWAFFYNSIGVPLAALGFISPIFCAAAMGFSDLIVIGNALRLLRWKSNEKAFG